MRGLGPCGGGSIPSTETKFRRIICLGLFVKKEKLQKKLEMVIRNMFQKVVNTTVVVRGVREIVWLIKRNITKRSFMYNGGLVLIGNTCALQAWVSSSNLLSSTKCYAALIVKWHNSSLVRMHYKFDSCWEHHATLADVVIAAAWRAVEVGSIPTGCTISFRSSKVEPTTDNRETVDRYHSEGPDLPRWRNWYTCWS